MQQTFWTLLGVENPINVMQQFNEMLKCMDFDDDAAEKSLSYLVQNFCDQRRRELLLSCVNKANSLEVPIRWSHGKMHEATAIQKKQYHHDDKFSKPKRVLLESDMNSIESLKHCLSSTFIKSDPRSVDEMIITVPRDYYIDYFYGMNQNQELIIYPADNAVTNLHEFGHVLAYFNGECVDPDVKVIGDYDQLLGNIEEFRNIVLSDYCENACDSVLLEAKSARVSHKGFTRENKAHNMTRLYGKTPGRLLSQDFAEARQRMPLVEDTMNHILKTHLMAEDNEDDFLQYSMSNKHFLLSLDIALDVHWISYQHFFFLTR